MKTLTEFPALNLKNAAKVRQELITAGKTAEELPAAMGEALKIEGDKLKFILNALELVGDKMDDLKRVIVLALNEGEKAPSGASEKEGNHYSVEYYPSLKKKEQEKSAHGRDGREGGKGGKRDGKGKGRGRRGDRHGDKNERQGAPRPRGDQKKREASSGPKPKSAQTPSAPAAN